VKKTRTENELAAAKAARLRGWLMSAIAAAIGAVMLLLGGEFLALHCVLMAGAAVAGGRAAAALLQDPKSARSAGSTGGMLTALGYAMPFIIYYTYRWATLSDADVARRLAALTPGELAQMRQLNMQPGYEYFVGQDVSLIFGYLLAALFFGWLAGMAGGSMARRGT
jgi:hypothetical protein